MWLKALATSTILEGRLESRAVGVAHIYLAGISTPLSASFLCKCLQIETLINRCYSLQIVSLSAWQLWLMLSDKWKENRSQQLFSGKSLIDYILMNLKRLLREPSEVYQKWRIACVNLTLVEKNSESPRLIIPCNFRTSTEISQR